MSRFPFLFLFISLFVAACAHSSTAHSNHVSSFPRGVLHENKHLHKHLYKKEHFEPKRNQKEGDKSYLGEKNLIPKTEVPMAPPLVFPPGNTTAFTTQLLSYGGLFVAALGLNGQIYECHQENADGLPWTAWRQMTMYCPSKNETNRLCIFDNDPILGRNADGRLEMFVRFNLNLDIWQMYMTDPKDPYSWTNARESSCVDQDMHDPTWWCLCPTGQPFNECVYPSPNYWNTQPCFPTSDSNMILGSDGCLRLYYRGFDNHYYVTKQHVCGDSSLYDPVEPAAPNLFV